MRGVLGHHVHMVVGGNGSLCACVRLSVAVGHFVHCEVVGSSGSLSACFEVVRASGSLGACVRLSVAVWHYVHV